MNKRIRVLQIIARLNIGGSTSIVSLLVTRLPQTRYDVRLASGKGQPQEGNYFELSGQSLSGLTVIPELGREIHGWADCRSFLRLFHLIRDFRPHIVHTHTAKAGALGRLAARCARVPVVLHTYYGHTLHSYFSPVKTQLFIAIERWLGRLADRLITDSENTRSELLALGIGTPEQFLVIPPGLDLDVFHMSERYRGQLRAELGVPATIPLVGMIARLVPIKRHEWFLAAAAHINQHYPACQFVLVGDGERRRELECIVQQSGLTGRVHFLGWRRELDKIYADLDVVALTSANESSPVSLIEAMAAGKPVVATHVGGVPNLIKNGVAGILVPPANPVALAKSIISLLADPQRRSQMGQAGQKHVLPAFNAQRLVNDIDQLYRQLLVEKCKK